MSEATVTTSDVRPAATPSGRATIIDVRSFVFWVLAVAIGYSALHLYSQISRDPHVQILPGVTWLALIQWTLYGAVLFFIVYTHQLYVRRSATVTVAALLWGGFVATWFAAKANAALQDMFTLWFSGKFYDRWGLAISAATNEELLKALGVVVLLLLPMAKVRSTLDGWYYGLMVGLGFQVVEDFLYTVQESNNMGDAVQFLVHRGLFAGLWAHAVYSGLVGAGIAYFVTRKDKPMARRIVQMVGLFAVAWFFHFVWDSPAFNDFFGDGSGGFFLTILVKGAPALATTLYVLRWGRRHERTQWLAFVNDHVDRSVVPEDAVAELIDKKARKAAVEAARKVGGRGAGRRREQLQDAQLYYIQCVDEEGADSDAAVEAAIVVGELRGD